MRLLIGVLAAVLVSRSFADAAPPIEIAVMTDGPVTRIDVDAVRAAVSPGDDVRLTAFPTPDGRWLDLSLERFVVADARTQFVVGAGRTPVVFDPDQVVLLRGTVDGWPGSHVFLAMSPTGARGRIELGPGAGGYAINAAGLQDGHRGGSFFVEPQASVVASGFDLPLTCDVVCPPVPPMGRHGATLVGRRDGFASTGPIREVELAIDTDYDLYVLFNDVDATMEYLVSLYGAVADVYLRDVDVTFRITFMRVWTDANDLFNTSNLLNEFAAVWDSQMDDVPRDVAQLFTGRRNLPAGGSAQLQTCGGYSWAGYAYGFFEAPNGSSVFNRDLTVTAHELGHNLGSLHTHSYGLDTCDDAFSTPQRGSIMSYCAQSFTGGHANADLRFHTFVQDRIRASVAKAACLMEDCNRNGLDDVEEVASGYIADVNGDAIPDECQDCNDNGVLDGLELLSGAAVDLNHNRIPDDCEPDCNGNGIVDAADTQRTVIPDFTDDFDMDLGWKVDLVGKVGRWERGAPVDDPSWPFGPSRDGDGSGSCFVTSNEPGTALVKGVTDLTSPPIEFGDPLLGFAYDYYFFISNGSEGSLRVEVSAIGGGSPWTEAIVHGNQGNNWVRHEFTADDLVALGLLEKGKRRVRFTASATVGFVEAGIDGFATAFFIPPVADDAYGDGVLDECEVDCDGNGRSDYTDIQLDMSLDLDRNVVLDACQDCNGDGVTDLETLDGAHDVWVAEIGSPHLTRYLWLTGTYVRESVAAWTGTPNDVLVVGQRVLVSIGEEHRVVELDADGAVIGDLVPAGSGGLIEPAGLIVTPTGELLVASYGTDSVLMYDLATGAALGTFVAPGAGGLTKPFGLAFGPDDHLYVGSDDAAVFRYDGVTGVFDVEFVEHDAGGLSEPRGMVFLPNGDLIVVSHGSDAVLRYDGATGDYAGRFNQNGTEDALTLDDPWGIRIGPDGGVYVSRANLDLHATPGEHDDNSHAEEEHHDHDEHELHLTNARIYHFDPVLGYYQRAYVQGVDSGIEFPTAFDFLPGDDRDCNLNLIPDACDIAAGRSLDVDGDGIPDECACRSDLNRDAIVGFEDLLSLLAKWGRCLECPADIDGSGSIDLSDLITLLASWGDC